MVCVVSSVGVVACINVIMRGVERCQSKQTKQPQKYHTQQCVCMGRVSPMKGGKVYLSQDTPEPTDILIRKTRAKRENSADRVGGSSHSKADVLTWQYHTVVSAC